MRIVRKTAIHADIPTASMADIAFLLIIFFMVTTVFSANQGLELRLPREEPPSGPVIGEEAVFIHIESDSSLTVDCRRMRPIELLDYLKSRLERNPDKPVILYSSGDAPYQAMVAVYDVIGSSEATHGFQVKNLSIPTQSEVKDYVRLFGYDPFATTCR